MAKAPKLRPEDILLTTKDNPFNPFTDDDNWRAFDTDYSHPYNTEAYYMRVLGMRSPDSFSPSENARELMQVFDEIICINQEMGIDLYELITRDGQRLQQVPRGLLFESSPQYA